MSSDSPEAVRLLGAPLIGFSAGMGEDLSRLRLFLHQRMYRHFRVNRMRSQARRILAFCGIEWDDACLAFHQTERPVLTASVAQVRQPIYRSAVGKWRVYERHLAPLLKELTPDQVLG